MASGLTANLLRKTFNKFVDHDLSTMAAALAYYTVFSLPSLLLILVFTAGLIFGQAAVEGQIQQSLSGVVGPQVAGQVQTMIRNASTSGGGILATVLGGLGLLFSATTTLAQLHTSLNRAWNVESDASGITGFARKRLNSFLLIVGISIVLIASVGASTVIDSLTGSIAVPGAVLYVAEIIVSLVVFALLFAAIFRYVPDAQIAWRDVWAGAAVTSVLFVAGKFLIGFYLSSAGVSGAYGAAGSLALLLLWTYYSSLIFLLGAEFAKSWAEVHGREVEPEPGAHKIVAAAPGINVDAAATDPAHVPGAGTRNNQAA